jgi:sporulation protein YlmC with PRC-barrel domain
MTFRKTLVMSSELRLKKLRGSGGYVMANVTDKQQMKGNLGGPDLFLAPIGRIDTEKITKYFCNTCEKEFADKPKIAYENPNEEVAENLMLVEKGQYICNSCNSVLAEYREFRKHDEMEEIGAAKPSNQETTRVKAEPEITAPRLEGKLATETKITESTSGGNVSSIAGLAVYNENAKRIGIAKQVGVDSNQTVVLVITKDDGAEANVPWNNVRKVGEIIMLGQNVAL